MSFEYLQRQLYWIIGYNVVMSAKGCKWCFMKKFYELAEPPGLVFLECLIQASMLLTAVSFLWSVTYLYLKTCKQLDSWALLQLMNQGGDRKHITTNLADQITERQRIN